MANCGACGQPVNDAVAKCPHCGEKQVRAGAPTYSRAEIQALIDNDEAYSAHTGSSAIFKSLLSPHKHTKGFMRVLELVLTGITLPAVVIGAFGIALLGARRSKGAFSTTGEIAPVVVMTLLGGGTIAMWLGGQYAILAIGAMWARAAVRLISSGQRERELIELDQRDAAKRALAAGPAPALPPSRPSAPPVAAAPLPAARAVSSPVRPSAPVVVKEPIKAPEPVKQTDPNDEPSILR
jgi:hypothetical protein